MGCFNVKCGLTGTDIIHKDDVVLLLGVKRAKAGSCGGWYGQPHQFHLLATPVFGKYNDYGWVENVDPSSWNLAMQCLDITLPQDEPYWIHQDPQDENRRFFDSFVQFSHDQPDTKKDCNVLAWVHRGAWDALIGATDRVELCHGFHTLDTTNCGFKIEEMLKFMEENGISNEGHNSLYDTRYQDREVHWVSVNASTAQRFLLCNWIQSKIQMDYTEQDKIKREALRQELTLSITDPETVDRLLDYHMLDRSRMDSSPFRFVLGEKLSWFFPFPGSFKPEETRTALKLLPLCDENPRPFISASAIYKGLMEARMVVRSGDDTISAGQCTEEAAERGQMAVAKFVINKAMQRLQDTERGLPLEITSRIRVEYSDLEWYFGEVFGFEEYSIACMEECGNDTTLEFQVKPGIPPHEDEDLAEMLKTKKPKQWRTGLLLNELCRRDLIPPGDYSVRVSW